MTLQEQAQGSETYAVEIYVNGECVEFARWALEDIDELQKLIVRAAERE